MYKAIITEEKDWDAKYPIVIHFDDLDQVQAHIGKIKDAMTKMYETRKKTFFDLDFREKA